MIARNALVIVAVSWLLSAVSSAGQEAFDKREVLDKWASLAENVKSARYTQTTEYWEVRDGQRTKKVGQDVQRFAWCTAGLLLEFKSESLNGIKRAKPLPVVLNIYNRKYHAKMEAAKAGEWRLADLKVLKEVDHSIEDFSILALPWLSANRVPLRKWLADDSFVIKHTEQVHGDGSGRRVRIHFEYDPAKRQSPGAGGAADIPHHVTAGQLELDPANWFRVTEYEYFFQHPKSSYSARGTLKYDQDNTLPALSALTVNLFDIAGKEAAKNTGIESSTYATSYNDPIDEREFRLSFYGLPEPHGVTWPTQTRWYLWFLLAGAGCVAASGFFWRRHFGRKPVPTSE